MQGGGSPLPSTHIDARGSSLCATSLSLVRHTGGNSLGAVTPGETFGTLYTFGVGTNTTKQPHTLSASACLSVRF